MYYNSSGTNNVALGKDALLNNTTASNNTAVGYQAGLANTTGNENTFLGNKSGTAVTTGADNTFVGSEAGISNTTGGTNVALGKEALRANTTGSDNTAVGNNTLIACQTGSNNTAVGRFAGENATGSSNTFIGRSAGFSITSGQKNTILGRYNGNQGGLDIRTSNNNIVLSDGDGNPRAQCGSSGIWDFGSYSSYSNGAQIAKFGHSGNDNCCNFIFFDVGSDTDRVGMRWDHQGVRNDRMWVDDTGDLRMSSANPTQDQSGTIVGTQSFSGTHIYKTDETDLVVGEAVCLSETKIVRANSAMSKTCVGIYAGVSEKMYDSFGQVCRDVDNNPVNGSGHAVIALGDTRFNQSNIETIGLLVDGSVKAGDLLCTSSTAGKLTVQSDDIIRSYTVAKAMEDGDENKPVYAYVYSG